MGGAMSRWNDDIKNRNTQKRIDEMAAEKGIRFPGPNEVLTDVPNFDNAGDAYVWFNKLTAAQLKQIKDIPFKISGRLPLTFTQRINLPSMNFDSLEKTTTSSALQQVFKKIKSGGEGIEEWVGAKRGGEIQPYGPTMTIMNGTPMDMVNRSFMSGQKHNRSF
jgi:hypothetical protein